MRGSEEHSVTSRTLLAAISLYQRFVSPLTPPSCRYYPSCSSYMRQAVIKYGPGRGLIRGLGRLLRCHPFHPGGYDPVE